MKMKLSIFCFLYLSILLCFSCGYIPQNEVLSKNTSISNKNDVSQNSEPALIVEKFMKYVAENKLAEANGLTKTEQEVSGISRPEAVPGMKKQREELASKLDWAQVFKERDFTLEKIVSNDISGKNAKVKTLLAFSNKYGVNMRTIFYLGNVNDQWFIYDIEFVTDKTESWN